jgi:hypothetical protein
MSLLPPCPPQHRFKKSMHMAFMIRRFYDLKVINYGYNTNERYIKTYKNAPLALSFLYNLYKFLCINVQMHFYTKIYKIYTKTF